MGLSKCEEMRKFYKFWLVWKVIVRRLANRWGNKIKMDRRKTTSGEASTVQWTVFT